MPLCASCAIHRETCPHQLSARILNVTYPSYLLGFILPGHLEDMTGVEPDMLKILGKKFKFEVRFHRGDVVTEVM